MKKAGDKKIQVMGTVLVHPKDICIFLVLPAFRLKTLARLFLYSFSLYPLHSYVVAVITILE